uniref:HECT domain-containing protein n=1 Tax=Piliocolobus tephrosceles TaxID=591936 RepID=A0A8C9LQP1_9PRIM
MWLSGPCTAWWSRTRGRRAFRCRFFAASNKISGASNSKPNRPSLAKILLSLDGNLAKQQALSHILTALQIMYARDAVVGALMPAAMVAPVECPSFSSAAPSDASAMASPMNGEECMLAVDVEDRLSPNPWQEKTEVKRSRSKGGLAGPDGTKSVFGQMCAKMSSFGPDSLLLPHCVWKVKFVGESVDDCGGGYSESIAEICEELQNGLTPLLIVTPNWRDESGASRDCYLLSPAARAPVHSSMFRFLGVLLGIAIRTGSPLSLNLAEPVWKQLAGMSLTIADLSEVDKDFIPGLMYIRDNEATSEEFEAMSLPFTVPSASGQDIQLSSKHTHITLDNRAEYVRLAINYRLHEFDEQVAAVREGMARVVPVPLLSLFTGYELETMVC